MACKDEARGDPSECLVDFSPSLSLCVGRVKRTTIRTVTPITWIIPHSQKLCLGK